MRLSFQILLAMCLATILAGIAIGDAVRRSETARMTAYFEDQSKATVSLLTGLTTEAIIVEDIPLVETSLYEAVNRIPQLSTIRVWNEDRNLIAQAGPDVEPGSSEFSRYEQNVTFEGETFGAISVFWSTREGVKQIDDRVFQVRLYSAIALISLSCLFLAMLALLVLKPLRIVHSEMVDTMLGKPPTSHPLPAHSAIEFKSLQGSVNKLSEVLAEREQRETALMTARQKADASSKAKSEFLANMSHEIRTPMNGVIGMAELILETRLTKSQRSYAETISHSGAALLSIINDILDFSKIEAGKAELNPEPFDLLQTLEDVASLVSSKAAEHSVEVVLGYQPDFPTCFVGDVGRIRQVVTNIVGNAVKFTLKGHVRLAVTGRISGSVALLRIDIKDTGIGIAAEKLDGIFSAFEQADSATNREFGGTGLGLAISNNLIALMGGKISANSVPGEGSVFSIELALPTTKEIIPDKSGNIKTLAGKRVLVVDDLEINRTILVERLKHWKMDVDVAASGRTALDKIQNQPAEQQFDVVLLDFNMPEMDGLETTRAIRMLPGFEKLPILLLTSVDQSADLKSRKALAIADVLIKPVRRSLLSEALLHCILDQPDCNQTTRAKSTERCPPSIAAQTRNLSNLRLLVAEDNATNRKVLEMMLKKSGAQIKFALNGHEACELFQSFRPDMLFMDVSMPVMDGLEATRKIREIESTQDHPHTNIVALTANARQDDKLKCLKAGMDDFLSKPFKKDQIYEKIEKWAFQKHA